MEITIILLARDMRDLDNIIKNMRIIMNVFIQNGNMKNIMYFNNRW